MMCAAGPTGPGTAPRGRAAHARGRGQGRRLEQSLALLPAQHGVGLLQGDQRARGAPPAGRLLK